MQPNVRALRAEGYALIARGHELLAQAEHSDAEETAHAAATLTTSDSPPPPWTKGQFARRRKVSVATIDRWVRLGLPFEPNGEAKRFTAESEAWLIARGRFASTITPGPRRDAVEDVEELAARAGIVRTEGLL
jgi:hypothetical protein